MVRSRLTWVALVALAAVVLALAALSCTGCGERTADDRMAADSERRVPKPVEPKAPTETPSPEPTPTPRPGEGTSTPIPATSSVRVYLVRDEKLGATTRAVAKTTRVAEAAMRELLAGPSAQERAWGLSSAVPAGTRLNGVSTRDGVATVDLSPEFTSGGGSLSMQLRAAQVVFTLTQFPTVERVAFRIDGKTLRALGGEGLLLDPPTGRADYPNVTPAILVEGPTPGSRVSSPMRIWGSSNTFEGTVQLQIIGPKGETLVRRHVQSQGGMGIWGPFDVAATYAPPVAGSGTVILFEESARDGSPINVVRVPVTFE